MTGPLGLETDIKLDIQCYCYILFNLTPEWESIIKYPSYASGSKQRNNFHLIQGQIRSLGVSRCQA